MFIYILLLFICLPLVEIAILIQLGQIFGLWATISLVVLTGLLGASLARMQGFQVYSRIQNELAAGKMPAAELIDGLLILVGGIVLLTPGLLSDLFGFALLIPITRNIFKHWVRGKFETMVRSGDTRFYIHF